MVRTVNLYEAKTHLSSLVEEAAEGGEIIIAKNGVARARLVPIPTHTRRRKPAGALKDLVISEDFDAPLPELERLFDGD
jgi:prevent-host-death family protein